MANLVIHFSIKSVDSDTPILEKTQEIGPSFSFKEFLNETVPGWQFAFNQLMNNSGGEIFSPRFGS